MFRRTLSLVLLTFLAAQMLGGFALAAPCAEPCPDDEANESCPPVCVLCTSCANAQSAIVRHAPSGTSLIRIDHDLPQPSSAAQPQLESDIFHVPLLG